MIPSARPLTLSVPLEIPAGRVAAIVGTWPDAAILESGAGFGEAGRWSIYAAEPLMVFAAEGDGYRIDHDRRRIDRGPEVARGNPLDGLALWLGGAWGLGGPDEPPPGPDEPPFRGGMIGFFGYDLAPRIERLPRKGAPDSRLPDVRFGLYDTFITRDGLTGEVRLWAVDFLSEGPQTLRERLWAWRRRLEEPGGQTRPSWLATPLTSHVTRAEYLEAVEKALEYIRAGDIFQVNLSQRFEARGRLDPLEVYLRLRRLSPAPFAAFLRWDDLAVVSASPEWFYQIRGDGIVTRPIKGTRPRGAEPGEDERLRDELLRSVKDRAELTMIVDLERNDLGRVCRYGSVRVPHHLKVESFAQVHHLVATVEGRLREGVGAVDIVRAVFPGGSITGAPKIRAMQIIDELEPCRRGVYTGAIGYYSFGASAFNIAIRTMVVEGDRAWYQVGGGIVADSLPELEFEETLHKGRALRAVLEGAGA